MELFHSQLRDVALTLWHTSSVLPGGDKTFLGMLQGGASTFFSMLEGGGGKCFFNVIQLKKFGGATRHQHIYINELISVFLGLLECGSQNK